LIVLIRDALPDEAYSYGVVTNNADNAEEPSDMSDAPHDEFSLYDLRVEVVLRPGTKFVCGHHEGDSFRVVGEDLLFDAPASFSFYALAALIPLLAAKQRPTDANDWITTDADVACPDPTCGAVFRITRAGQRRFSHAAVTWVPLPPRDA
jgi:uncharacterized repeat protein (TIGR04076 family)